MSKRHDAIFDDVLSGFDRAKTAKEDRGGTRFLKRSTTIADRISGDVEEKTLRWVDPADCRMWDRHNRDYALLNEENCRDLIDGIRAQGRQEFPAIVRALPEGSDKEFEVICGARRHFAVSWLRANNYPQFKYLIDVRELTDEEAFRLSDIENRDREDISDYERALDYADAIERYYGGRQKTMAERLEVSQPWLSRYLVLAKLPNQIISAFPSIRDIKERHARELKPLLSDPVTATAVLQMSSKIADEQTAARNGTRNFVDPVTVMKRLRAAGAPTSTEKTDQSFTITAPGEDRGITVRHKHGKTAIEFSDKISSDALWAALTLYMHDR